MSINNLTPEELEAYAEAHGEKKFRGKQLFTFFNKSGRVDLEHSNLPKNFINQIPRVDDAKIFRTYVSKLDDTKKFLFELNDGNLIEGVLMHYKHGYSQCISTQVGCRMGCVFCASTKKGLVRNLTSAEMLRQVYTVEAAYHIKVSNVILMGSGEPMDNYDNVLKFLKLLHHPQGHHTSYRNMTLSTCGVVDGIDKLAREGLPITLAISLHSPYNDLRSDIMPINRKYNLEELIAAAKRYSEATSSRITFEYTLIAGENDTRDHAVALYSLLKGLRAHINLIPLNAIEEYDKGRSTAEAIQSFKKELERLGAEVTIRRELGSDISASCGQLRRNFEGGIL
ncbi:23S rRNA (adenine(2503)-C(2))-methyltransferase RlmN [Peptoniphilus equinus]|uniref:Probable dual-specificity RNA methyltransferase RlmN n=1 Tax=Peptoniphilus equinus TaxID=3016343 RepID=A0ABY7QR32_9FIRM|nr:23S rRNA (adenine(2503)-C(2))-methyltransferase RlmN [Peptoniphilus equinus]WBW49252.1 23S rRNA (adenine(2503)-C(2))-methyltransferase RlmN [Peptoniphilus equinus]